MYSNIIDHRRILLRLQDSTAPFTRRTSEFEPRISSSGVSQPRVCSATTLQLRTGGPRTHPPRDVAKLKSTRFPPWRSPAGIETLILGDQGKGPLTTLVFGPNSEGGGVSFGLRLSTLEQLDMGSVAKGFGTWTGIAWRTACGGSQPSAFTPKAWFMTGTVAISSGAKTLTYTRANRAMGTL